MPDIAEKDAVSKEVKVEKLPAQDRAPLAPGQFWDALRGEMDRTFERLARTFAGMPALWRSPELEPFRHFESAFGLTMPAVDVVEHEQEYIVTAELPGLDESDLDVSVSGDTLTLKGTKHERKEQKAADYFLSERRFGAFQRAFRIPQGTDPEKIAARFEKGVLTVTLPKTAEARKAPKKIPITK